MSLSGCSCWLAKGDGAVGKGGLLSSCVHSSTVLSSKLLTYFVKMSAIVNESNLLYVFATGTIFGVNSPCFCLGNTIFILSLPNLVTAWDRPKFSLRSASLVL